MTNFKSGDWLSTHLGAGRGAIHRYALVVTASKDRTVLRIDGKSGYHTHEPKELKWWTPMRFQSEADPPLKVGGLYTANGVGVYSQVEILAIKPGYVGFLERFEDYPELFRITPYDNFIRHWSLNTTPTAWERIMDVAF